MNRTIITVTAGAGIALAALLLPALGAGASTQHPAQEPSPANIASSSATHNAPAQQYSWATGFDNGSTGPSWMQENFLIKSQSLKDRTGSIEDNHSITETYVRDAAGNAFEFGVSSDGKTRRRGLRSSRLPGRPGTSTAIRPASYPPARLSPHRSSRQSTR